jgi:hypothetical protein
MVGAVFPAKVAKAYLCCSLLVAVAEEAKTRGWILAARIDARASPTSEGRGNGWQGK